MDEASSNFKHMEDDSLSCAKNDPTSDSTIAVTDPKTSSAGTYQRSSSIFDVDENACFVECCYISLGAILGCLIRIGVAQLFGDACANPGTVGWLSSGSPLCVTKDGETTLEGGIVFADLPSNLLGCFVMGFFQDATVLGLAVPMAVAWLRPNHPFQCMDVLHLAIRTGFCGSLTTFSSWNSEMIVITFGTGTTRTSQFFRAVLGYIVGMETSMGSFACGKSVAKRVHRMVNPTLAAEAVAMRQRKLEGVYMNPHLPEYERRFLADLKMNEDHDMLVPIGGVDSLLRWRQSTENARRVGHRLLPTLIEIENSEIIHHVPASPQAQSLARAEGWDIDSLQAWMMERKRMMYSLPSMSSMDFSSSQTETSRCFSESFAGSLVAAVGMLLLIALVVLNGQDAPTITYRTMVYSMILAPFGALLRWRLSKLNQKLSIEDWKWYPLGTFLANLLGSTVSIIAVALEYKSASIYESKTFWTAGSVRAVKIGFAGSLTTVSTFVAEVSGYMTHTSSSHAYPYMLTTICCCGGLSAVLYALIISVV